MMPSSQQTCLAVTVIAPNGQPSKRYEFPPQDTISIGRSSDSDLVLQNFGGKISRCHGVVLFESGNWEYFNVGANGSFCNGKKIASLKLVDGTVIRLDKTGPLLRFQFNPIVVEDEAETDDGSFGDWIARLKSGDEAATQTLWDRYFPRILEVARRSLRHSSSRVQDEEDVAMLVLRSLLAGIKTDRFASIDHRDQLWRLLMVITTRKAADIINRDRRSKRGGGNVRGDSAMILNERAKTDVFRSDSSLILTGRIDSGVLCGFDRLEGEHKMPDIDALVADETRELLSLLPDEGTRQVAQFKMEGLTHEEIAVKLSCNVRTVERRIKVIREMWTERMNANDSQ